MTHGTTLLIVELILSDATKTITNHPCNFNKTSWNVTENQLFMCDSFVSWHKTHTKKLLLTDMMINLLKCISIFAQNSPQMRIIQTYFSTILWQECTLLNRQTSICVNGHRTLLLQSTATTRPGRLYISSRTSTGM